MSSLVARSLAVILLLSILMILPSTGSPETLEARLHAQAVESRLYEDNEWLDLLYYRKEILSGGYRSQADDERFFLSPEGERDPYSEMMATIDAMFFPVDLGDEHPRCRFPARISWLIKHLDIDRTQIPTPDCGCLSTWKEQFDDVAQVTVVFPAAYMNSPSSMFGHLFLRFDPSDKTESSLLTAPTINFAADTAAQTSATDYIYRGLLGGFPCTNTVLPFYRRLKQYSDIENRDMWEYTLNLSTDEIDQLILHLWELERPVFDYFFLDENCAYRLVTLLDIARPDLCLADRFTIYTTPVDAIRSLDQSGAIESTAYKPSAIKTFYAHATTLDDAELQVVLDIVHKRLPLDSPGVRSLPPKRKALTLALTSEYLALLVNKDMINRDVSAGLSQQVFVERAEHPLPPAVFEATHPSSISPHWGHGTHRISAGVGWDQDATFLSLEYRSTYHSLLDPIAGFERGAQTETLDIELRGYENSKLRFEHFRILDIISLNPINRFFKPVSWKFTLGGERKQLDSGRPLLWGIGAGGGITLPVRDRMFSVLGLVAADFGKELDNGYGLSTGLSVNFLHQGEICSYDIEILSMKYIAGDDDWRQELSGRLSFPLGRDNALSFQAKSALTNMNEFYEIHFGIHHYF